MKETKENNTKDLSTTTKDEITGKESKSDNKSNGSTKSTSNKRGSKFRRTKKFNDPSWYIANDKLAQDAANVPFAVYNGVTYDLSRGEKNAWSFAPLEQKNNSFTAPGILVYKYVPWYGEVTPTSALNLTMRALYSYVRHVNSGRANYEAPDLMLYIMAMDSMYLRIHEVKRLLRLTYTYMLKNRDIPERIFQALGIDLDDAKGNIANYRARLNMIISKVNSLAVPNNFNIFKRRAVLGSSVFSDEPGRATQLYIAESDGYYVFDPKNTTGGRLTWESKISTINRSSSNKRRDGVLMLVETKSLVTIDTLLTRMDTELTKLLADEDINIMSGDIIKAYGDQLYKLPFIEDNEVLEVIHDEDVLLQFNNANVLDISGAQIAAHNKFVKFKDQSDSGKYTSTTPIITQKDGSLVAGVELAFNNLGDTGKWVETTGINLRQFENWVVEGGSEISPGKVLEWTRLIMTTGSQAGYTGCYLYAGTEIGIGWLTHKPTNERSASEVNVASVEQWFQFGSTPGYSVQADEVIAASKGDYIITIGYADIITWKERKEGSPYNTYSSIMFISKLNYGPRSYPTVMQLDSAYTKLKSGFNGNSGAMRENSAIVSSTNIRQLHDVALLGLISSPYTK